MQIDYKSFTKKFTPIKNSFPDGMFVYKNQQGSGKTTSMVYDGLEIVKQFPDCKVFANLNIKNLDYTPFKSVGELLNVLRFNNGQKGVLILLDEGQNYFNKKNGVPIDIMTQLCQNRKNRRCILMTSQIWDDLDVALRKQVKRVINVSNFLNIQINRYYNGYTLKYDKKTNDYIADKIFTKIFKRNNELLNRFDTFEIIETNQSYNRNYTASEGAQARAPQAVQINLKLRK